MPDSQVVVRDFIYLDADKLYSMYSQLFKGVVEQIVESFRSGEARRSNEKAGLLEGRSLDTQVAEVSARTENKVLHDHMYHRLEERIAASLVSGNDLNRGNFREKLEKSFLVRATGSAEIEDYQRMETFLSKFNELGEAIAYSQVVAVGAPALKSKGEEIANIADRNQRKRAEAEFRRLSPESLAKKSAADLGLTQDKKLMENLQLFTSLFHRDAYEVTIVPCGVPDGVAFRGVLNKRWLRVEPEHLSALYGGFVESNWTIVGQVAHLPGEVLPMEANADHTTSQVEAGGTDPSMRDPFQAIFRSARVFERMFLESQQRTEVTVSPIALYRAMEVTVCEV